VTAVLLSIKPEFAKKIFAGTKKFEFRKSIFKYQNINKIIVYASSPVKKVIGEFLIDKILIDDIDTLWNITSAHSGITKEFYQEYFKDKNKAYAIKIGKTIRYKKSRTLNEYNIKTAPQSFVYIKGFSCT